jgi:intracellular septation protein
MTETTAKTQVRNGAAQLFMDLGPILVFILAFNVLQRIEATKDNAVFIATGLFIVATLAAIAWAKFKHGRIPPVLIVTGVVVVVFGGLTIVLREPSLVQIKVTVTNLFYVAAILGSMLFGHNIWKLLFGHAFTLPDRIWNVLALRWAGFFAFMAALNEVLRYYFNYENGNFEVWLNTRPLVVFPLVLIFAAINTPLVLRHSQAEQAPRPAP